MRAHLDNAWTLARLAKIAGASRAAFVRLFVAETGMAPMACLRELRLARAAELLVSPSDELGALPLGLDELAARVGYGNAFALSRAFKRRLGLAPIHYRDRILGLEGVRRATRLPITSARAA